MTLPTKFATVIKHEPGLLLVGKDVDGAIHTIERDGQEVTISSADGQKTTLYRGIEQIGKTVVDSYLPDASAAPAAEPAKRGRKLGAGAALAICLVSVGVTASGLIWIERARNEAPRAVAAAETVTEVTAPETVVVTVEEANLGNRPSETAVPAPEQPTVELPTRVITTAADADVTPTETAAVPAPTQAETNQATGAAGIAERTAATIEDMNGTQAEARELVAENGAEAANSQLADLRSALTTLTSGGKLTPEALDKLPHELAAQLRAAGAVQSLEEFAASSQAFDILRLPPAVVDQYMDEDGVPTIPDANGWVATGGIVRVPLPGGGDISRPEHLMAFGLQP